MLKMLCYNDYVKSFKASRSCGVSQRLQMYVILHQLLTVKATLLLK